MSAQQVNHLESSSHKTITRIYNFASAVGDITNDVTNPHAYQVFTFQIDSTPVGDYDFFISYDGVNFIAARVWAMATGTHTTTTTGVALARFTLSVVGARVFRVTKRTAAAVGVMTLRKHHFAGAHSQRTKH